jgi:hypothetical protein
MNPVIVGTYIVCVAIGVAVGAVRMCIAIKETKAPRERAFVIRKYIFYWASAIGYLFCLWLIPKPYIIYLSFLFSMAFFASVRSSKKTQARIRSEESNHAI